MSATLATSTSDLRELKRVKTAPLKPRDVPKQQDLVNYKHAVAGHDGTMCDAGGELFVKPCTHAEVEFYESAKFHPDFAELMPVYCGSLALLNTTTAASIHQQLPGLIEQAEISKGLKDELKSHLAPSVATTKEPLAADAPSNEGSGAENKGQDPRTRPIKTDRAIALLNASYGFKKPNIMDTKMGQQLWSKHASQEKRERFDKISESTTHKNFGFRIAGMQVYGGIHPTYPTPDGTEQPCTNVTGPNEEGFMMYNKFFGRDNVNDSNLVESLKLFIFNEAAGIDEELGKFVAGLFANDLRRVEEVLQKEESRMYSSSLLFVFEGDGSALRAAIEEAKAEEAEIDYSEAELATGIDMGEEELKFVPETVVINGEMEEGSGDDDDEFDEMSSFPHIYALKMIDFAHAEWTPGLGPDEAVLLGVRSLAEIFEKLSD
ncbi:SAICAR synthase-like protein [Nemania sp. FL0916]|nr:SAICAR synthase-like protein [Nemania sp. FL0916]